MGSNFIINQKKGRKDSAIKGESNREIETPTCCLHQVAYILSIIITPGSNYRLLDHTLHRLSPPHVFHPTSSHFVRIIVPLNNLDSPFRAQDIIHEIVQLTIRRALLTSAYFIFGIDKCSVAKVICELRRFELTGSNMAHE